MDDEDAPKQQLEPAEPSEPPSPPEPPPADENLLDEAFAGIDEPEMK
jgi:hypothetical protein